MVFSTENVDMSVQPIQSNTDGLFFCSMKHAGDTRQEWICLRVWMVAAVPWPGEYTECDIKGHAVLVQGPRRIGCTLGDACVDDGIDQQGGDLVGSLARLALPLGMDRRHAIRA